MKLKPAAGFTITLGMLFMSFAAEGYAKEPSQNPHFDYFRDWQMTGSNTVKYEYYDDKGHKPLSVYPHDASQVYNETALSLLRNFSPYESAALSTRGLINGSEYRSTEQGWVFEDVRASWQKGDAPYIPFRVDLGDYTESLSYRTIQQNLKGVQVELQPTTSFRSHTQRHSIIGFYGMQQIDYRDLDFNRDIYSGGSWLTDLARGGVWGFHFVNNYRQEVRHPDPNPMPVRLQGTWGTTFEKVFEVLKQRIGIEAEVDQMNGDYETSPTPLGVEEGQSDIGTFFKLNGASGTLLDYGFRFEEYGEDFHPHGAAITPNRRTLSWTAGRKLVKDIRLDGRVEFFRDNLKSANRTDTMVEGLALSGPVSNPLLRDLYFYFNISRESIDGVNPFTNIRTWSYVGDINSALYEKWSGHFGFNLRNADDEGSEYLAIYREFTGDVGRVFSFWDVTADARLGTTFRENSGLVAGNDVSPFGSLSLEKGRHRLGVNASYLLEDSHQEFGQDVSSFSFRGGYSFTYGPHRLAVDFDVFNRNPYERTKSAEDYRIGISYTLSFDKPAGTSIRDFSWKEGYRPPPSVLEDIRADSPAYEISILDAAAPGADLVAVQNELKTYGIENPRKQGNFWVYEARIFKDIHWRQQVVLEEKDGEIVRTALLIDLDPAGDAAKSGQAFELVRGVLLKRYGNPSADITKGSFSQRYAMAINSGTLVRVTDWSAQKGVLRFGIPPRFNQPVRIEIHYAASMSEPRESRWGLEVV